MRAEKQNANNRAITCRFESGAQNSCDGFQNQTVETNLKKFVLIGIGYITYGK